MKQIIPSLFLAAMAMSASLACAQMPSNQAPANSMPGQAVLPTLTQQQQQQQQQFQQMQAQQATSAAPQLTPATPGGVPVQSSPGYGGTADQILSAQPQAPSAPAAPVATTPAAPSAAAPAAAGTAATAAAPAAPVVDPCAAFMSSADLYASCQDRNMKIQRMKDAQKSRATAAPAAAPAAPVTTGAQNGIPQTTYGTNPNGVVNPTNNTVSSGVGQTVEQLPSNSTQQSDGRFIQKNPNGFIINPIKKQIKN